MAPLRVRPFKKVSLAAARIEAWQATSVMLMNRLTSSDRQMVVLVMTAGGHEAEEA